MNQEEKFRPDGIVTVDGREAVTVRGAIEVLNYLAQEIIEEHKEDPAYQRYVNNPRRYGAATVNRYLQRGLIGGKQISTVVCYYFLDDLYTLKNVLNPIKGTHTGVRHYSDEIKWQARELKEEGLSHRDIAKQINVSYQTVNNWLNKQS